MSMDPLRLETHRREERKAAILGGQRPQGSHEVIEVVSSDEDSVVENEIVISDDEENRANNRNGNTTEDRNGSAHDNERHNDNDNDDDIQITHVNHINEDSHSTLGRRALQSLERRVRRRLADDGNEDSVQFLSETPGPPDNEPLIQSLDGQRLELLRQLNEHLDGVPIFTPRGGYRTASGSRNITNILEEIRRLSQQISSHVLNRSRRQSMRRLRPRGRPIQYDEGEQIERLEGPLHLFGNIFAYENFPPQRDSNEIEHSIMARIDRDNDNAFDSRMASEKLFNKKLMKEKLENIRNQDTSYTSNIKQEESLGCELCGVELGVGIPDDFIPDPRYNDNLEQYTQDYRVQAPWFCTRTSTEVDKMLSKRVFAAKCGHVYCGRCVKNIGDRPTKLKSHAKGLTMDNPLLYAPRKCPAVDCSKHFTAKGFIELYP